MGAELSRRRFVQIATATGLALAFGPNKWGWAGQFSPFGELQDDPILRLPEGFEYKVIAETGTPLLAGAKPFPRPQFPDLNVAFEAPGNKILLSTSHEVPFFFPAPVPPSPDDYDPFTAGAVTSLLLNPDLTIAEGAYNAGGMSTNCSGSGTPWKTVLTGEEDITTVGAEHGFIWEVDPDAHTKTRLDACGKFEHETAVVDPHTGYVYLTEDSGGDSLLYRMRPKVPGRLAKGGVLEAYRADGTWVTIDDPLGEGGEEPSAQGIAKGALEFERLEGGRLDHPFFYFTETEDATSCGKVWRLDVCSGRLELWAQGSADGLLCMPDNLAFDAAGNAFVCEDKSDASNDNPNHVVFIDRRSGEMAIFAELVLEFATPRQNIADEPTGPEFSPDGRVLFLNLQRTPDFGRTLAITGPFRRWTKDPRRSRAAIPPGARSEEHRALATSGLGLPLAHAAALVALRRRGRIGELSPDLEGVVSDLGAPEAIPSPKRRATKI